ncbi:MAG TPA: hypothetical protein VMV45_13335 [Casimicrobiaceae bacterium]|nr:hypothetical protein [Casimicrobiaceae bacterium]
MSPFDSSLSDIGDPRSWPDPSIAGGAEPLHALALASLSAATADESDHADEVIDARLRDRVADPNGLRRALDSAPSASIYRHLWTRLARLDPALRLDPDALRANVFAFPIVVVAGVADDRADMAKLDGVVDVAPIVELLRNHHALGGNRNFALAGALLGSEAVDVSMLARFQQWSAWRVEDDSIGGQLQLLEPAPMSVTRAHETVHLRFLLGVALASGHARLLDADGVGKWGTPLAQALSRQLAAPGLTALALPRPPRPPLIALAQGRAAQREVSAQLFVSAALRRFRASVGEPGAVVSAHRSADSASGGELRLSLSSPFYERDAEGFRCPLARLDNVREVAAMLVELLNDCRVATVRVLSGVHADRHADTGTLVLFKAHELPAAGALH